MARYTFHCPDVPVFGTGPSLVYGYININDPVEDDGQARYDYSMGWTCKYEINFKYNSPFVFSLTLGGTTSSNTAKIDFNKWTDPGDFSCSSGSVKVNQGATLNGSVSCAVTGGETYFNWGGEVIPGGSAPVYHTHPSGLKFISCTANTNSMDVNINWTDGSGGDLDSYANVIVNEVTKESENGGNLNFTGLTPNTNYYISSNLYCRTHGWQESIDKYLYTSPELNSPTLSLQSGQEHDRINVTANSKNGGDQYRFRISDGSWSGLQTSNEYYFSGLTGNTNYKIGTQMYNSTSGLWSAETTATITTWYDPLINLNVVLLNKWFWYIYIQSSYNYSGSISKWEFSIGPAGQAYTHVASNAYSVGTTDPNGANKLSPYTDYTCKAKLTDNHGRTYEKSIVVRTLQDKCCTVDRVLRTAFVIDANKRTLITPNLMTIINSDNSRINMNKKINNDDRLYYR